MHDNQKLISWLEVNGYMREDFREIVVREALGYLPRAPGELRSFADNVLSNAIPTPGFRSFKRALTGSHAKALRPVVEKRMQQADGVAAIVVCLWAEGRAELVSRLRTLAEGAGLRFRPDWSWRQAIIGYRDFDAVPDLDRVANSAARDEAERDQLLLGVLWLSSGLSEIPAEASVDALQLVANTDTTPAPHIDSTLTVSSGEDVRTEPEATEDTISADDLADSLAGLSLLELQDRLNSAGAQFLEHQLVARTLADRLLAHISAADLNQLEAAFGELQTQLVKWKNSLVQLASLTEQVAARLQTEQLARPDLEASDRAENAQANETQATPELQLAHDLLAAMSEISAYDQEKQRLLAEIESIHAQRTQFEAEAALLDSETAKIDGAATNSTVRPTSDPIDLTLTAARTAKSEAEAGLKVAETRLGQMRTAFEHRVVALVDQLRGAGLSESEPLAEHTTLGDVASSLSVRDASGLLLIEHNLQDILNVFLAQHKSMSLVDAAELLRDTWTIDSLGSLLEQLATEQRDAKTLLLLIATSTNQASFNNQSVPLSPAVVDSLLRGLEVFSSKSRPYDLLATIAGVLLPAIQVPDAVARAKLSMVLVATQYAESQSIPGSILWSIGTDWPLAGLTGWNQLWQTAVMEQPLPAIVANSQFDAHQLDEARADAQQQMARQAGAYQRLGTIKSDRHRAVVRDQFMGVLGETLESLLRFEERLKNAEDNQLPRQVANLRQRLDELGNTLDRDRLSEELDSALAEARVVDEAGFHRRTSMRVVLGCAESILKYGKLLLEFWQLRASGADAPKREELITELAAWPELAHFGQSIVDHLVQAGATIGPAESKPAQPNSLSHKITPLLLSQSAYTLRLPRLVGHLAAARINAEGILRPLIDDICEPVSATNAAKTLIDNDSPNQALLLAQQIGLDLQKQAQLQKGDLERETMAIEAELLRLGGSVQDLAADRDLGRWRLVRRELAQRLTELRIQHEAEKKRVAERAKALMRALNALSESALELQSTMSVEAYRLVEQGLGMARSSLTNPAVFDQIGGYVEDMNYRLEHQSLSLGGLQDSIEQLQRTAIGATASGRPQTDAGAALNALEHGELTLVGLNPDEVPPSEVNTRIDVLRNWLTVRSLKAFLSTQLGAAEREAIQALFQAFGRMVVLRHVRAPDGRSVASDDPVVYAHEELQFPRTKALDNQIVLLALPGNPPNPKDVADFERLLSDKDWLEYFFVLAFVPGATPAIRKRLEGNNHNRGLIIVDESALLTMVLAEADEREPLGVLRSLMLNSLGAHSVDIFDVNHLVNNRTAIFVGRETLIERISSSGDNYALYGGRRIGKSSVLDAVETRLERRGTIVVSHSFEGDQELSDDACAKRLTELIPLAFGNTVSGVADFKPALEALMDADLDRNLVFLLDEIDRYVTSNPDRHVLIESFRALSERYSGRFRVIIAGFMSLYDVMKGRGPYSPGSDPWGRMLNDTGGPLPNLHPSSAENIAREGFLNILGWSFENRAIPQLIVQRTGGHPAFVQHFCGKLQHHVGQRGDRVVRLDDVNAVFDDDTPGESFIAYVQSTLNMNLKDDPIGYYVILWLSKEASQSRSFTVGQFRELACLCKTPIPEPLLLRSLERLNVTRVVRERVHGLYEFSVPDYPLILARLGQTALLDSLESDIARAVEQYHANLQ